MSDKTNRKSGAERRQERAVRESKEKKKIRLTAIVVVTVLAVLFCGALVINSNYIRRSTVAVSVGGLEFSPIEFDYFFSTAYSEYQMMIYEYYPDNYSSYLPSGNKPLKSQMFDSQTGETWYDYFESAALATMSQVAAIYDAAQEADFVMSDEKREEMNSEIESLRQTANLYGYGSLNKYLQSVYGPAMNEKAMAELSEILFTVEAYSEHIRASFDYSADELAAYYDENKDELDVFTYRYMLITAEDSPGAVYSSDEEFEELKAEAVAEAVVKGEEIAAGIKSEQDFIDAAREYDEVAYGLDDSTLHRDTGGSLNDVQGPWLKDSERTEGDVTVIETTNGCYVQYFVNRSENDYNIANLRLLLIKPETVSSEDYESEDDPAYGEAVATAKMDAQQKAELVLAALKEGGETEDKFIELIGEYSTFTAVDGLFENVYRYRSDSTHLANVGDWPFEEGRAAGDYELISLEDGSQYIVFLSSFGEMYKDYLSDARMRQQDYTDWDTEIGRPEATKHWAFVLTQ